MNNNDRVGESLSPGWTMWQLDSATGHIVLTFKQKKRMKKMSIKSKQAQHWLAAYNASNYHSVKQAYAKPSSSKIEADREYQERCQRENGYDYKIISASFLFFTAAWMIDGENLRVETAYNSYIIKL